MMVIADQVASSSSTPHKKDLRLELEAVRTTLTRLSDLLNPSTEAKVDQSPAGSQVLLWHWWLGCVLFA
jgi:hypothetical protein